MSDEEVLIASDDEEYDPTDILDDEQDKRSDTEEPRFTESEKIQSKKKLDQQILLKSKVPDQVNLFLDLEDKTSEALTTFTNINYSTYANKSIGDSGQNGEFMPCECYEDYEDGVNHACSDDDCLNRGTKTECINGHSSCGKDCSNQRFQKRQYANINVIQTEKKGYGVRTQEELVADTFIYEYIGEVIDEKTFKKRMIEYDQSGIKHFYFMMLQKGEFVDATKKGSLGRFLNHSCNPNCYVEKWVVGDKLKMGIFSKRKIFRGEELTFNYNVDRYGATAQQCFCGEANCIGFIGGKTQTDAASLLPQIISEALGSSVELEQEFILEKKQKGEKVEKNDSNINVQYVESLVMNPVEIFEINKVLGVLLQCEDTLIADKLIKRIELTDGAAFQKKLSSPHGLKALLRLLQHYYEESENIKNQLNVSEDLVLRILNVFIDWRPTRSGVEKTDAFHILKSLKSKTGNDDAHLKIDRLISKWSELQVYQSIRKTDNPNKGSSFQYDDRRQRREDRSQRASPSKESPYSLTPTTSSAKPLGYSSQQHGGLPYGWYSAVDESSGRKYYYHKDRPNETQWEEPEEDSREDREKYLQEKKQREKEEERKRREWDLLQHKRKEEHRLNSVIERAKREEEAKRKEEEAKRREEEEKAKKKQEYKAKLIEKKKRQQNRSASHSQASTPKPSTTETEWKRLIGGYIPHLMKPYLEELGKDEVKKHAKEITHTLVQKEMAKDKPVPSALKSEKREKIKDFTSVYMNKILSKYRAKIEGNKRKSETQNEQNKKQHT